MAKPLKHSYNQAGDTWNDGFIKFPYLVPAAETYEFNLQRVLIDEQEKIFKELEDLQGIELDKDESTGKYFNEECIRIGLDEFSTQSRALHIVAKYTDKLAINSLEEQLIINIYCTLGGNGELQNRRASLYTRAIGSMIYGMARQELVRDWPKNIIDKFKTDYQPEVKLDGFQEADLDVSDAGIQNQGPVPGLVLKFTIKPKTNVTIPDAHKVTP